MRFDPSFNKHQIKLLFGNIFSLWDEGYTIDFKSLFGIFISPEKFELGYNLVLLPRLNKLFEISKSLQIIISPFVSSICFCLLFNKGNLCFGLENHMSAIARVAFTSEIGDILNLCIGNYEVNEII